MYIIRNIKYDVYFDKHIKDVLHFVKDRNNAFKFNNKLEAKKIFKLLNKKENFEIIKGWWKWKKDI